MSNGVSLNANWKPLYVLAMTARSGSTMLCSAIKCIEELGEPAEYFNNRGQLKNFHARFGGRDFSDYLHNIFNSVGSVSHTLGIKSPYMDFKFMAECPKFTHLLPYVNFVYLTRRDIFAQSVSLWRAKKTNLWHSHAAGKSKSISDPVSYNYDELVVSLMALLRERICWESLFSLYGLTPLRMAYEDICGNNLKPSVQLLAKSIGFDISEQKLETAEAATIKLGTGEQDETIDRFRSDVLDRALYSKLNSKTDLTFKIKLTK